MEQFQEKQLPTKLIQQQAIVQVPFKIFKSKNMSGTRNFSFILTSSSEKARGSYSPNPSINEQRFERFEVSAITPRFSIRLSFIETSCGSCRHPKTCDRISLVGTVPSLIISRYTIKASIVLRAEIQMN